MPHEQFSSGKSSRFNKSILLQFDLHLCWFNGKIVGEHPEVQLITYQLFPVILCFIELKLKVIFDNL